jgi:hypothetical protein
MKINGSLCAEVTEWRIPRTEVINLVLASTMVHI